VDVGEKDSTQGRKPIPATPADDIPQFEVSSERVPEGPCVVRVVGELDISHEDEVRTELRRAVESDGAGIVVDLTECAFIDSSGVRALLLGYEAQREDEDDDSLLAVAAQSEQIIRILTVMGVDKVIPVRPSVDQAIAELRT
jgi:anti-sigma B factor antagonist